MVMNTDLDGDALTALLGCGCRFIPKAYPVMVADKVVWLLHIGTH